jgi:chromosome segregation ATPase
MARLGVTYQDIATAANQLISQGRQPTIELIRHILGTGSSTTIANHFRQWKIDQQGGLSLPQQETLPNEMLNMLKGLWERLNHQAGQKATEIEAKTQEELTELNHQLAKYQSNNRRWQKLFLQWQQDKEKLLEDKKLLELKVAKQQKEIELLHVKLDAKNEMINEKRIRIEELHHLLTAITERLSSQTRVTKI